MSRRDEREVLRRLSERRPERESEPPADLLERLRVEIPAAVRVHPDATGGERESRPSARQRWLLAASLAAMVGMGLFSLHVLESGKQAEEVKAPSRAGTAAAPPPESLPAPAAALPAVAKLQHQLAVAPPTQPREKKREDSQGAYAPRRAAPPPAPSAAPQPAAEGAMPGGVAGGVVGGVPGGVARGTVGAEPTRSLAEEDRPASPEPAAKSEMMKRMAKPALSDREENRASLLARGGPVAEGAPAPLAGGDPRWLLLFRLGGVALAPGAQAEVTFDPTAVTRSRRIGEGADLLYEVKLQPGTAAGTTVATLRSHSPGGETSRVLRTLRVADLTPAWDQASADFRLTSLAAELEEVLAGTRPRSDLPELLRHARELAGERPGDARAADLLRRLEQAGGR